MLDKLKQIDQNLIELLSQRIAALEEARSAETNGYSLKEETILSQRLAQLGVPQFVWKNLVTSCAAATAASPLTYTPTSSKRIAVIGGNGRMGRFLARQLLLAEHQVSSLGRDWQNAVECLQDADLVLICVPIQQTLTVIQQVSPYLSPSTTLADITGVKTPIVQAMLKLHPGPILSLHPMFGPGVESFLSQNVVICPGRSLSAFQWFLDLIRERGANLITCTPEEHDQMMVTIQAIRHFLTFGLGVFLVEAGIDLDRSLEFASPPYRLQFNLVNRLFAQDATLHVEMMLGLEERRQAIGQLADTYSQLAQLVKQNDQAALKQVFESTGVAFQQQLPLEESNHVIESLSLLLAARKIKPQCTRNLNVANQQQPVAISG